ncbi:DUF1801 domain-containing protein [Bacillus sp. FJAT-27225]|uniref:DUF1801 domain-containing protein n=1 Tax=Bacillus sp. FJAT-27225 TaxID=1743144 RepID=UPI000980CC5D|nr:DUF1801 domain-containing protein [Bacillus sp. FJAT-27225]
MAGKGKKVTVSEYLENCNHPMKELIEQVRSIILSMDVGITEHIKWNAPSFCFNGDDRITFRLSKPDYVQLVFHSGGTGQRRQNKETYYYR